MIQYMFEETEVSHSEHSQSHTSYAQTLIAEVLKLTTGFPQGLGYSVFRIQMKTQE